MIQVKQCRHGRLMFYDNDAYIGHSLNTSGTYSEEEILLWQQIVRPDDVVVEVGANIGVHTVWFAKAVKRDGKVFAIEPQRQMYQMLVGNLALNEITNTNVMMGALGDKIGTIRVPPVDYHKIGNFGGLALGGEDGEEVPIITLDSFRMPRVDLIKIDVEGMEASVLRGARETIERCQPVLYVENDRKEKSNELIALIGGMGYRLYKHAPLINRDLFRDTVSLNMLCMPGDANIMGLYEIDRDHVVRQQAKVAALEHGAVL